MLIILVSNETSVAIPEILILKTSFINEREVLFVLSKCFCPNHKQFARKNLRLGRGGAAAPSPPPPRLVRYVFPPLTSHVKISFTCKFIFHLQTGRCHQGFVSILPTG